MIILFITVGHPDENQNRHYYSVLCIHRPNALHPIVMRLSASEDELWISNSHTKVYL
jgi:hypothetical protein